MGGGESAALNFKKSELKYLAIFSGLPFNLCLRSGLEPEFLLMLWCLKR